MAQYTNNAIYTYIESAVNTANRPVYCTSRYEPVPEDFPACYIHETDHRPSRTAVQLDFQDEQLIRSWEVQAFSNLTNGALAECYDIIADAEIAFKQLFFIETSCSQVQNADPSVVRVVARFTRVIGSADTMPTTE